MGCTPGPSVAAYSASKSLLTSMSRALDYELRGTGVSVTASCPGWLGGNVLLAEVGTVQMEFFALARHTHECEVVHQRGLHRRHAALPKESRHAMLREVRVHLAHIVRRDGLVQQHLRRVVTRPFRGLRATRTSPR